MSQKTSVIGIIISIAIIISSLFVFTYEVNIAVPMMDPVELDSNGSPDYEEDKYYGGDAYTGMQQAAAQAANNLIPVYNVLDNVNKNMVVVNGNMQTQATVEANNLRAVVGFAKIAMGFVIMAIGLANLAKYLGAYDKAKKEAAAAAQPPEFQPPVYADNQPM